jgi:curved DNA-binding protein CbpA
MNLNSHLFDRIRVKPSEPAQQRAAQPRCEHPGCSAAGTYRAPMGRLREGQYFFFCLDHVREYNASYNYFAGMSDEAVARYQRDAIVGHRPTWHMGVNQAAGSRRDAAADWASPTDPLGLHAHRARQRASEPEKPRHNRTALRALDALGLDDTADAPSIKSRYKELVKRLHPDANGGDRSSEEKLREIIRAYNYLRSARLV